MTNEAESGAVERLHADEVEISDRIVDELITDQFPQWAALPLRRVASSGTVNVIYRLGDRLSVRLPRAPRFEERDTDCWLDHLAGRLPLPIPEPVEAGQPNDSYPLHWAVHTWIDGETWTLDRVRDPCAAAETLAEFIHELHAVDPSATDCPPLWDGGSFASRDDVVRIAAEHAHGIDAAAVLAAWDHALAAQPLESTSTLIHWDLLPGNILVHDGAIAGVIDWGALALGDPSRDLLPTWTLFDGASREAFRGAMASDESLWARARGWALAFVVGAAYYEQTNPVFAAECRTTVDAVLREFNV